MHISNKAGNHNIIILFLGWLVTPKHLNQSYELIKFSLHYTYISLILITTIKKYDFYHCVSKNIKEQQI